MNSIWEPATYTGIGGILAWIVNFLWRRRVHKESREDAAQHREDKLTEHSQKLAMDLLELTSAELKAARLQINELSFEITQFQQIDRRLSYFEEALLHIEALLNVDQTGDREAAEHNARLFMAKMTTLRQVKGIEANREQRKRAATRQITEGGE